MPLTKEQLDFLRKKPAKRRKRATIGNGQTEPVVWIPDGTTLARFLTDSEGNDSLTYRRHKRNKLSFICHGPGECEVCQLWRSLVRGGGWDDARKFKSREVCLAYGVILEYEGPSRFQYVPLNTPVLLMHGYKLANSLADLICDLRSEEEIQKFFDPNERYRLAKIQIRKQGLEFSMHLMPRKSATVPSLPQDFRPLREMVFAEDGEPDPAKVDRFKAAMERSYEKSKKGNRNT